MENLHQLVKEQETKFLETLQLIVESNLSPTLKILKVQTELEVCQSMIQETVMLYQMELHENDLPF